MPLFEPGGGKNAEPASVEDYRCVRLGKGSPEQIAKVREALANKFSPLYLELGESAPWARMMIERKFGGLKRNGKETWPAYQNFLVINDFVRDKRLAGALSDDEANIINQSMRVEHLDVDGPTASTYAMCVARMMRVICRLRPDLAAEVKNLPMSRRR